MKTLLIIIICLLYLGCAASNPLKELGEEYTTIQGTLAAQPLLEEEFDRIIIYLKIKKDETGKEYVIQAVGSNPAESKVLRRIMNRLETVDAPVFIYGNPINGQYQEQLVGFDFEIVAIGIFNPVIDRRDVILVTYGTKLRDAIRNIEYTHFLKSIAGQAIDVAK